MHAKKFCALSISVIALLLTGCGAAGSEEKVSSESSTATKGTIVFGVSAGYPPLGFRDAKTNEPVGFDIEFGNAIARELDMEPQWEDMQFDQLINSIKTNRIDVILSGMTDNEERRGTMDFIDYLTDSPEFFTLKESVGAYKDLTNLCGKAVATVSGTTYVKTIEAWSKEKCDAGNQVEVLRLATGGDVLLQIRQERADAGLLGNVSLAHHFAESGNMYEAIGAAEDGQYYGIGTLKRNDDLRDDIFAAVNSLKEAGVYQELLKKYGLEGSAADEFLINGESTT